MRRRSGALHCESELDFMQLAEAAHDHIGIFYDERTNRKVMTHLQPLLSPPRTHDGVANPELSAEKRKEEYRGFDFGLESEAQREEREQLCRANGEVTSQLDVAIVTADPSKAAWRLSRLPASQARPFDLLTERRNNCQLKYWIMSKQHKQDALMQSYLELCAVVVEAEGESARVAKGREQWGQLAEELRLRLSQG